MRIALAALFVLLVAGCGGSSPTTTTVTRVVTTSDLPSARGGSFETCVAYLDGGTVSVEFAGASAESACAAWIKKWSTRGDFWTRIPRDDSNSGEPVCSMAKLDLLATVSDDGSAVAGRYICSRFASAGWTETP